jgi:hypothetical protein
VTELRTLRPWEQAVVDNAVLFRRAAVGQIRPTFAEQLRALEVLDATPAEMAELFDRVHAEIVAQSFRARAWARREAGL